MRIAHITDMQLGCRQYGLVEREEDYYRAAQAAMGMIAGLNVDAVLATGDHFEAPRQGGKAVKKLQTLMDGLDVYGIEGNHDASGGDWLRVCGIQCLEDGVMTVRKHGGLLRLGGLNYVKDCDFMPRLKEYLDQCSGPLDIMCLHQGFTEVCPFTAVPIRPVTELLKAHGVKYVACGHIHNRYYYVDDGLPYSCPGSTEMTDMDEKPEKWFSVIDTDTWQTEYHSIPVRPIAVMDAADESELQQLLDRLRGRNYSFVMARINRAIVDGVERVESACRAGNIVLRMMAYSPEQAAADRTALPSWERDKGMLDLRELVAKSFAPGTEQHALITQIIDAPDRAEDILTKYINTKLEEA